LHGLLKAEQEKVASLQADVHALKRHQVEIMASAEAQEEYITNMLLKRLDAITTERDELVARVAVIQKEREALIVQLEQEEEYLTNTLQKKLTTVLREKIELENQLEQEEEYIVNELQKKLAKLQAEKHALEVSLREERESHETLRKTQAQLAKAQQQNADLQRELSAVRGENFGLTQKISKEHQMLLTIAHAKAKLEQGLEMEDERAFNDESRRPGSARHRTRSQSLPVQEGDLAEAASARALLGGHAMVKSSSGSSGLNASVVGAAGGSGSGNGSSAFSSNSTSATTSSAGSPSATLSPPTSPRLSHDGTKAAHLPGATLGQTGQTPAERTTRSRRLSLAANASLMHHYPSTPRSTATTLKQGWMRSLAKSKLPVDPDVDPEPETELFFVLSDDSTLIAWINELHGEDGSGSIFCINLDTVQRITFESSSGDLSLETKDYIYDLHPQSEDAREWHDLLEQLDPLASGSSTPSHN
jgi:hypothetical protein